MSQAVPTMESKIMRKHTRPLKHAFVVTLAIAAGGAGGCGDATNNPPSCADGTDDCLDPSCPSSVPLEGGACGVSGTRCEYAAENACGDVSTECTENGWAIYETTCNPPPPDCPVERPEVGSMCAVGGWGYTSGCEYGVATPCGGATIVLGCEYQESGDVIWIEQMAPPPCQVPPEQCQAYADGAACAADPGCQWLAPGCFDAGGEVPIPLGCYPIGDCDSVACDSWGVCSTGIYDPCADEPCDACAAEISVCAPATP